MTATSLAGKRLVVTGANGFLGRHFVEHARSRGAEVLPLVRTVTAQAPAGARTLADALADPDGLLRCDALAHLAAVRHRHGTAIADYEAANHDLVATLLRAAAGRAHRFVHVSSVGVYGFPRQLPVSEEHPYAPATDYSASKVKAERLVTSLAPQLGLPHVIVRPTITYGPGDSNGMLDKLVTMIDRGHYLLVGRGDNVLHHTHVDDFVAGLALAATVDAALGEGFILSGPETTTLRELSTEVARLLGRRLLPVHVPLPVARGVAAVVERLAAREVLFRGEPPLNQEKLDVMCRPISFDSAKARRLLGFAPTVGYGDGLRRTIAARARGTS